MQSPGNPIANLTHLDDSGTAHMVDVSRKAVTLREAVAEGFVRMLPETLAAIAAGNTPKGDVISTARLAGIMAAKQTANLIPLCHPLPLKKLVSKSFQTRRYRAIASKPSCAPSPRLGSKWKR